jgi:hypothetical protein
MPTTTTMDMDLNAELETFLTESVSVSDSLVVALNFSRSVNDSVGVSDGIAVRLTGTRTINDTILINDAISVAKELGQQQLTVLLEDNLTSTDALDRLLTLSRTFEDSVSVLDALSLTHRRAIPAVLIKPRLREVQSISPKIMITFK